MHDDELMDRLLRDAMAAEPPELSATFDTRIMERIRPRRLTPIGQVVIALYILLAAATAAWFMRDLPAGWIAAAILASTGIAAAASAYGRRVVFGA